MAIASSSDNVASNFMVYSNQLGFCSITSRRYRRYSSTQSFVTGSTAVGDFIEPDPVPGRGPSLEREPDVDRLERLDDLELLEESEPDFAVPGLGSSMDVPEPGLGTLGAGPDESVPGRVGPKLTAGERDIRVITTT